MKQKAKPYLWLKVTCKILVFYLEGFDVIGHHQTFHPKAFVLNCSILSVQSFGSRQPPRQCVVYSGQKD